MPILPSSPVMCSINLSPMYCQVRLDIHMNSNSLTFLRASERLHPAVGDNDNHLKGLFPYLRAVLSLPQCWKID